MHEDAKVRCPYPVCDARVFPRSLEAHYFGSHAQAVEAQCTFSVCKVCGVLAKVGCGFPENETGSLLLDVLTSRLDRALGVSHTW